jgi:uncharacterized protein YkwD
MRRESRALVCAVIACAAVLAVPAVSTASLPSLQLPEVPALGGHTTPSLVPAPVADMVAAVNATRARHGLRPYLPSASLRRSATAQSAWMLHTDRFSHRPRIHASRRYGSLGEAIAWHSGWSPRVAYTVRAWLASPGHRRLVLSRRFRYLGAGMSRGRFGRHRATTWTLQFGT